MLVEIGRIEALYRYPVKSMAGERLESAELGWHGIEGDRRLALRRVDDRSGFPWLTASKLRELILFAPQHATGAAPAELPTHVRTPEGDALPIFSDALAADIERRHGAPVQMMHLKHGVFDDATISVIATDTVEEICRLAERPADVRRFRPNVVVRLLRPAPFQEDGWLGGALSFGEGSDGPSVSVTMRDLRCSMIAIDPDSAASAPEMVKAAVRANQNQAGVYGTVIGDGRLEAGQRVFLTRGAR